MFFYDNSLTLASLATSSDKFAKQNKVDLLQKTTIRRDLR